MFVFNYFISLQFKSKQSVACGSQAVKMKCHECTGVKQWSKDTLNADINESDSQLRLAETKVKHEKGKN